LLKPISGSRPARPFCLQLSFHKLEMFAGNHRQRASARQRLPSMGRSDRARGYVCSIPDRVQEARRRTTLITQKWLRPHRNARRDRLLRRVDGGAMGHAARLCRNRGRSGRPCQC
jgi:hypothetical protein